MQSKRSIIVVALALVAAFSLAALFANSPLFAESEQAAPETVETTAPSRFEQLASQVDVNALVCDIPDEDGEILPCHLNVIEDWMPPMDLQPEGTTECVDGEASGYACRDIDLVSFLPLSAMGGGSGNDIWGWTDEGSGRDFAIMGRTNGTSFIEITDPTAPVYLGNLPSHVSASIWRDVKTYQDHAYIVADFIGNHGLQVFDLTQLLTVVSPPVEFTATNHYDGFGSAHNIVINEDSGFGYVVGISSGPERCAGGLYMLDLSDPANPVFAGCFSNDGYTHDAQCVMYTGPDADYQGREICINSNTDTVTIVDVTDKSTPIMVARQGYAGFGYTHQGWLTEDQKYFLLDDEGDEGPENTRTYIWDVTDLDNPILIDTYEATTRAIDHNLYIKGDLVYQANYRAGLRILDASYLPSGPLIEVGFFDIFGANDLPDFNGAWSNYPYFDDNIIIVSGIEQGLYVLRYRNTMTERNNLPIIPVED